MLVSTTNVRDKSSNHFLNNQSNKSFTPPLLQGQHFFHAYVGSYLRETSYGDRNNYQVNFLWGIQRISQNERKRKGVQGVPVHDM